MADLMEIDVPGAEERHALLSEFYDVLVVLMPMLAARVLGTPDPTGDVLPPPWLIPLMGVFETLQNIVRGPQQIDPDSLATQLQLLTLDQKAIPTMGDPGATVARNTNLYTIGAGDRSQELPYEILLDQEKKRGVELRRRLADDSGHVSNSFFKNVRIPGTNRFAQVPIDTPPRPSPDLIKGPGKRPGDAEATTGVKGGGGASGLAGAIGKKAKGAGGQDEFQGAADVAPTETADPRKVAAEWRTGLINIMSQLEMVEKANESLVSGPKGIAELVARAKYTDKEREMRRKLLDSVLAAKTEQELAKALCDCGRLDPGHAMRREIQNEIAAILRDPRKLQAQQKKIADAERVKAQAAAEEAKKAARKNSAADAVRAFKEAEALRKADEDAEAAKEPCWSCNILILNHSEDQRRHDCSHTYSTEAEHAACNHCTASGAVCRYRCGSCRELEVAAVPHECSTCTFFEPVADPNRELKDFSWQHHGTASHNPLVKFSDYVDEDPTNHRRFASNAFSAVVDPKNEAANNGLAWNYINQLQLDPKFKDSLGMSHQAFFNNELETMIETRDTTHSQTELDENIRNAELWYIRMVELYMMTGRMSTRQCAMDIRERYAQNVHTPFFFTPSVRLRDSSAWKERRTPSGRLFYENSKNRRAVWQTPSLSPHNGVMIPGQPGAPRLPKYWTSGWDQEWQKWQLVDPDGEIYDPPPPHLGLAPGSPIQHGDPARNPPSLPPGAYAVYSPQDQTYSTFDKNNRRFDLTPTSTALIPFQKELPNFSFDAKDAPTNFMKRFGDAQFRGLSTLGSSDKAKQIANIWKTYDVLVMAKLMSIAARFHMTMKSNFLAERPTATDKPKKPLPNTPPKPTTTGTGSKPSGGFINRLKDKVQKKK